MSKHRLPLPARKALGARLKTAREASTLTQTEAAQRLGLSTFTTLSNYEQGRAEIPLVFLAELSELYRVRIEELVFGAAPPVRIADLPTRRRYTRVQEQSRELVGELAGIVRQLERLFTPPRRRRASGA